MHFRSIVLEMLEQRPIAYQRLKQQRMLMEAVNTFGMILKQNYEAIVQEITQKHPERHPTQIAHEAFETALNHLEKVLPSGSEPHDATEDSHEFTTEYISPSMPIA